MNNLFRQSYTYTVSSRLVAGQFNKHILDENNFRNVDFSYESAFEDVCFKNTQW